MCAATSRRQALGHQRDHQVIHPCQPPLPPAAIFGSKPAFRSLSTPTSSGGGGGGLGPGSVLIASYQTRLARFHRRLRLRGQPASWGATSAMPCPQEARMPAGR